jgi:hypothetical protein
MDHDLQPSNHSVGIEKNIMTNIILLLLHMKGTHKKMEPHISYVTETIAYLRFCHVVHYFMEPCNYHSAPINKGLCFIQSVVLIKGYIRQS